MHFDAEAGYLDKKPINAYQCFELALPINGGGVAPQTDEKNRKVKRFDARFHSSGVENVNTFTSHWGGEHNWLCPPIAKIGDAIKHARICKCKGILLVPEWHSAYFWPLKGNSSVRKTL